MARLEESIHVASAMIGEGISSSHGILSNTMEVVKRERTEGSKVELFKKQDTIKIKDAVGVIKPEYFTEDNFLRAITKLVQHYYEGEGCIKCPACGNPLTLEAKVTATVGHTRQLTYIWLFRAKCLCDNKQTSALVRHYLNTEGLACQYNVVSEEFTMVFEVSTEELYMQSGKAMEHRIAEESLNVYRECRKRLNEYFDYEPAFFSKYTIVGVDIGE